MHSLKVFAVAALAGTIACSNETPVTPRSSSPGQQLSAFARSARAAVNVPAVRIDLPTAVRPWDTSATALAQAIARGENYAVIAIKEPGSARALETGIRASVLATTIASAADALRSSGLENVELLENIGAARVRGSPAIIAALRNQPWVDFIEPRQYLELAAQTTPWGISMVRAPQAWTITTGSGAKIEFIDTGHQQGHEDLPFVPSANCAGAYGGCDDGNGHGTHVMGIALARDNTIGVVGVGRGIAASDVFVWAACTDDPVRPSCSTDQITAGINAGIWTVHVISMSVGGTAFDAGMSNAVAQAWANNIVLVAAAGNDGGRTVVYPANYTNVIGVSGVNQDKSFANPAPCGGSSNWGPHVDLAAPFTALSTYPVNRYVELCGTSMATPHVSGAAALVRARNPSWSNQQIVNQLLATAEDRGVAGRDDLFGYGIVDAAKAVGYQDPPPPPAPAVDITGPSDVKPGVTCSWVANASGGTPPYNYGWTVNGGAVGNNSSELLYTNQGYSFTLGVNVSDAAGASTTVYKSVTVSSSAPSCLF